MRPIFKSYASQQTSQQGFSLLELMVGLTIGLFILLGVTNVFMFISSTQRTLSESTALQQQGSLIMRIIGYSIRQAGGTYLTSGAGGKFGFDTSYDGYNATGFNVQGTEGGADDPDTLQVSQQNAPLTVISKTDMDCLGNKSTFANRIDNQYSLDTKTQSLMCLGSGKTSAQAIAIGVEDFQVRYGIASLGVGNTQELQYFNADKVPTWADLRAVEVCIVMNAIDTKNEAAGGSVIKGCDDKTIASDGKIRKIFTNTFFLRNSHSKEV